MWGDLVFLVQVVLVLSTAAIILANSPIATALAKRASGDAQDPSLREAFDEQAARLVVAEDEIEKLSERLQFTERLISARPQGSIADHGQPAPNAVDDGHAG